MEQGELVSFIVETDRNKLFFNSTRSGFLVCVAQPDANLGLIRVEMRAASERLNNLGIGV
jgi:predicted regulator of Ras-like GTPase activity (Roadblock/LC7/MglB family)